MDPILKPETVKVKQLIILCGFLTMVVKAPPAVPVKATALMSLSLHPLLTGIHGVAAAVTIGALFLFFLKAGAFVFGSGLAIVPFLRGSRDEVPFVDRASICGRSRGSDDHSRSRCDHGRFHRLSRCRSGRGACSGRGCVRSSLFGAPYHWPFAQNTHVKA